MPEFAKSSASRYWIAGLVLIAVVLAWKLLPRDRPEAAQEWTTAKVERGRMTAKVTASGTLSALVTVQVGSQVSGRIAGIYVDFNSPVKKGQVIARIDPQLFDAALAQVRANLQAAQANLARAQVQARDAERQAKRADELVEQKLISQSERDTTRANADAARAGVTAAEAAVAQSQASVSQAEVNLAYTTIASPTDGVVISRSVDVGQTVAASLQAPTLFVIAQDLRQMQVNTNVAESDIGKLTADMPVSFTVDAYPQERFKGRVRQIRNSPTTLQNVVTYDAVVGVENPELKLRPGMTANVSFVYADKDSVLQVPSAALRFRPSAEFLEQAGLKGDSPRGAREQGQRQVWVLREGKPQALPVRTGVSDGSMTEIVEGELREGEDVITEQRGSEAQDKPRAQQPMRMF